MDEGAADRFRKELAESQLEDDRARAEALIPDVRRRPTMGSGAQSLADQVVGAVRSLFRRRSE